jgi:hypothetical protein
VVFYCNKEDLITTTLCLVLYKWAVHENCMYGFCSPFSSHSPFSLPCPPPHLSLHSPFFHSLSVFSVLKHYQWEWKEMWSIWSILKLYQQEWNRLMMHFTKPKFLQVIDPYQIVSLVFERETEMWSVFSILKLYQWNWNRKCEIFSIFNLN